MAFERRTWYQRLGQGLNKFLIGEKDAEGKQELTNAPDSITQQGDVISADNLNDLEGRIAGAFTEMKLTKIWENSDPTTSFSSQTISFTGLIDELVIEYTEHQRATKFVQVKPVSSSAYGGLSLIGTNESEDTIHDKVTIALNTRTVNVYYSNGDTKVNFANERTIQWEFTSGVGDDYRIFTLNDRIIPVAIYSVGEIYNS